MRYLIYITSVISAALFFTNCDDYQQNNKNTPAKVEEIDQFKTFFDEYPFINEEFKESAQDSSLSFYEKRNFQRIWFENDSIFPGKQTVHFYNYLNNDTLLNLIPSTYPVEQRSEFFENSWGNELQLFLRLSYYLNTRENGLINLKDTTLYHPLMASNKLLDTFILSKPDSLSWIEHLITFKTKNKEITRLHKAINSFVNIFPLNQTSCEIDSSSINSSVAECLKTLGYQNVDSLNFSSTLQSFQYNNGIDSDGIIGDRTIKELQETNYHRYLESIITLDRLRQTADTLAPSKIIKVNIPKYTLTFINNDTVAFESRVIVGKSKTRTPVFQSKAKYIVTNPYWYVPYSIASKETLYSIKKDTSVLREKGYEILKNNEVINADSIDWKKYHRNYFPFKIRQKFGPSNSLGKVKLLFPNEYAVYIHDTPAKHLFQTSKRSYSHGCIRTQFPDSLAKTILKLEDHAYRDSLDSLFDRNKETYLQLHDRFPISIEYQVAIVDDSTQQLRIFPDIYGRLEDFIELATP